MIATQEPPNETLELVPAGEPIPTKQLAPYDEFKTKIESLKKTAETITVTDISQTAEMKIARATRLSLKEIRVAITHKHKELKAGILEEGRKLDDGKNQLLDILEPLELRLKDQEDFIERETTRIQNEKRTARAAEITPFLSAMPVVDLGTLTDEQYAGMLSDAKDAHAARLAREQKAKEEAAAKAKAEAEERERIRLENIRLKEEAEAREAAAKKEREAAAAALAAAQDKAREEAIAATKAREEERRKFEEASRKQREQDAALRAEADARAKKERDEIEAKARREREAAEAKAKIEREAADKENARLAGIAEAERQKAAAAFHEAKQAREKIEHEEDARKAAEEKAEAERLAAIEAAALAPEKDKLTALAATVRAIVLPTMTTEKGIAALAEIEEQVTKFAKYIEKKAASL